jgi:hypothetical protein
VTCSHCGTELPPGAMFCGECGRAVTSRGSATSAASVAEASTVVPEPVAEPSTVVPEPIAEAAPEGPPEVGAQPEPVAEALEAEPEPDLEPEPVAEAVEAEPEPEPEPARQPEPELVDLVADTETCAQCGAVLASSDIFCGECGFVRRGMGPASRPSDTAVLDPFPWGLPRSTEHPFHAHVDPPAEPTGPPPTEPMTLIEPERSVPFVRSVFVEDDDVDETRIVDRSVRGDRFVLQFSTGESVSVAGTGLIGRNPVAEPGEYFDSLIAISDPGKSVSKTHLEFGQDNGSFWVSDRFSGNGTIVREPERAPRRCDAGKRYRVARGTRIEIGEQFFIVS